MEKVHVLVCVPLEETDLAKIRAVDPRLEVTYAVQQVQAESGQNPFMKFPLDHPIVQPELTPREASEALDRMLVNTEIIYGWRIPRNILARAPHLKWVQRTGAGVDDLADDPGLFESDVIVTNAAGIRTIPVAEFTLCLALILAKRAPRFIANKEKHLWETFITSDLHGKMVGIIGLGRIGSEVAKLALAFGTRVLATDSRVKSRDIGTGGIQEVFPSCDLLHMLPACDFVILTLPLTPETRGLIGETELRAIKPTSYIINVARGPIIKQDVLIQALKEGWIAGAALDTFDQEPLPPESELWDLPNVVISPHFAGFRERMSTLLAELFCDNLRRFLNGKELINVVDKKRGF